MVSTFEAGSGKYRVSVTVEDTGGRGLIVSVLGGTRPHVGGAVVAIPRAKTQGEGLTCDVSQVCLPGHKDVYAAVEVAKYLAVRTGEPVSATAGMHVDHASKEDIACLLENSIEAAGKWVDACWRPASQ